MQSLDSQFDLDIQTIKKSPYSHLDVLLHNFKIHPHQPVVVFYKFTDIYEDFVLFTLWFNEKANE